MRFSRARQAAAVGLLVTALVAGSGAALSTAALADESEPASEAAVLPASVDGSEASTVAGVEPIADEPATSELTPSPSSTHLVEIPTPVITSPPSGTVSLQSSFPVAGTVEPGLDLIVLVEAYESEGAEPSSLGYCEVPVAAGSSTWECDLEVEYTYTGEVTLSAAAREDAGETPFGDSSESVGVVVDPGAAGAFTSVEGFSNEFTTQSVTLEGTGPANGSVQVVAVYYPYEPEYGGETTTDFCSAPVNADGEWQCTGGPLDNGGSSYFGYVYFEVFATDYFGLGGGTYDDEVGGDVVPGAPSLDYRFSPSTIAVSATGDDEALVAVELYTAEFNGEGYSYGFVDACGDAIGEGGDGEFAPESAPFVAASTQIACEFGGLEPGIWNIYYAQEVDGFTSDWVDDFIRIPESPAFLSSTVNADRSVRFSGTGTPGDRVDVLRGASGSPQCSATVAGGGAWVCTATPPAGTAQFRAVQVSVGFEPEAWVPYGGAYDGVSALSPARTVAVPAPPAPAPPAQPAPPVSQQAPVGPGTVEIEGLPANAPVGSELTIEGSTECIEPIVCDVDVDIFSTPQRLGSTVTDPAGAFALRVVVPTDIEPGEHTIVVTVTPRGGPAISVSQPIMIAAAPEGVEPASGEESPAAPAAEAPDEEQAGEGEGTADGRDSLASPSALTDAIPTAAEIFRNPIVTVTAGGLALAILLLVAFPTELLNSTLSANTRRFGRGFAAFERGVDRVTDWFAAVTRTRAAAAAVLIVVTSVIFGFMDPSFGFDAVSLRLTLALAIGLFLVTYVSSWISGAIIWRAWRIETSIGLQPAALVFALIGVVIARLLEFSPGFLIGLVIGLEIVTRVGAPHRVRAVLTQLGVMVGISVLAWVGYSILTESMSGPIDWVTALALDSLAAATAEGLTAAAVAILPLGFLEGREIFQRSKALWVGAFLVTAMLFALLVLPTEDGIDEISNVGTWFVVLVAFAVVTLALWAVLHYTNPDRHADDGAESEGAQRETATR